MALYEHLDKVPKPHATAVSIVDLTFGMNVQVGWLRPSVKHAAIHCACAADIHPLPPHSVLGASLAFQRLLIAFSCACDFVHQPQSCSSATMCAGLPWLHAA